MNEERMPIATEQAQGQPVLQEQAANPLDALLQELGMSPEQAAELLSQVVQRSTAQRRRAEQVLEAIELIGDPNFTVQSLRVNKAAMEALEAGENIGSIYRRFFLRREPQAVERDANLGAAAGAGLHLTRQDIERISEYVDRTGRVYSL